MIMIVKTPGSQMGSPAAAEEGGEEVGGGNGMNESSNVIHRLYAHPYVDMCRAV